MRDASVWAFSEFFFLISSFFFVLNGSFILCTGYKLRNTHVKSGDNENGPKRCIVWAISTCFYFFSFMFYKY